MNEAPKHYRAVLIGVARQNESNPQSYVPDLKSAASWAAVVLAGKTREDDPSVVVEVYESTERLVGSYLPPSKKEKK